MKARKILFAAMAITSVMFFNSCTDDPCKDVTCANGTPTELLGSCSCVCDAGYEGSDCSTVSRDKFLGNYNYASTDTVNCPQSGTTAQILSSTLGVDRIIFHNNSTSTEFYATVDVDDLTLPNQEIVNAAPVRLDGNGSINAGLTVVTINVTIRDSSNAAISTCTFNYTKI